jgi:hypothetical protein
MAEVIAPGDWAGIPHATWFAVSRGGRVAAIFEQESDALAFSILISRAQILDRLNGISNGAELRHLRVPVDGAPAT